MREQYSRTERIMGPEAIDILRNRRVAVFGVGGVGGFVVEGLVRAGIGTIDIIDDDSVVPSNLNRQIIATHSSIGRSKVDVFEDRIHDINPETVVHKYQTFYMPDLADQFDFASYDYVVDAIDTVTAKLDLICRCTERGIPVISAMGCGNRFDPTQLTVTDIHKTSMDPLAKVMRRELKKRGIKKLKVVYSTEPPIQPYDAFVQETGSKEQGQRPGNPKNTSPGSTPFVPAAAGLIIASQVVKDLTDFDPKDRIRGGRQN